MAKIRFNKTVLILLLFLIIASTVLVYMFTKKQEDGMVVENQETSGTCIEDGETFSFMDQKECCEGLIEQSINRSISVCTTEPCAGEAEEVNRNPLLGEPYDTPCCPTLVEDQVSKSYSICRSQTDSD